MTTQVKIVATTTSGAPSSVAPQTATTHSTTVPAGSTVLGSAGQSKPLATADQQLCTVPVHVAPDNSVSFYFNGMWRRGDGSASP
jgi:hypothetical protein